MKGPFIVFGGGGGGSERGGGGEVDLLEESTDPFEGLRGRPFAVPGR